MIEDEFQLPYFLQKSISWIGLKAILFLTLLISLLWMVVFESGRLVRGLDTNAMMLFASLGLLFTWRIAGSRVKTSQALLLIAAAGVSICGLFPGRLWLPLGRLVQSLLRFLLQAWYWLTIEDFPAPEWGQMSLATNELGNAASALISRIYQWLVMLVQGKAGLDPLVNTVIWSLVFWAIASWAGWFIQRHGQVLGAVLPAGVLLASILNYSNSTPAFLLLFLAITLTMMVLVNQSRREEHWENQQIDYSSEIRFDLTVAASPVILLILVAAALIPSISVKRVIDFVGNLSESQSARIEQMGESLGLSPPERQASRLPPDLYTSGLPRQHLIGSGPELSEMVVMIIKTGELAPGPPEAYVGRTAPRHYWSGLTYDIYTGRGWTTSPTGEVVEYEAGQLARLAENFDENGAWILPEGYHLFNIEVKLLKEYETLVYSSGRLISVDQNYTVGWRANPASETGEPGGGDMFGATLQGQTPYRTQSLLPTVSMGRLIQAGSDYPEWVTARYLSLPTSLPQRVRSLALDITANAATPYGRAQAIENYLRQIPYSLDVPQPPIDQDVTDYYLFELQKGYCDYSATAMTVLARAAGLPARLVMGYASGDYDTLTAQYLVTEADAHSWVEIYFPGVGWVEFEPTGGQPEIDRPDQLDAVGFQEPYQVLWQPPLARRSRPVWTVIAISLAGISLFTALAWNWVDNWMLLRMTPGNAIDRLYRRMLRRGRNLTAVSGQMALPGETPYEFAFTLSSRLADLAPASAFKRAILAGIPEVNALAESYSQAFYSPRPLGVKEQWGALSAWRKLRWRLWLVYQLQRINRGQRRQG